MDIGLFMNIVSGVLVPVCIGLFSALAAVKKDLADFKVQVAREYATNETINRFETKIDELRNLIIAEIKKK